MKKQTLFLLPLILLGFDAYAATACSRANLTRCLDSVCAINVSSNPAARCQYCGTSGAGTPPKNAMRSVSVGASAKYNISDKELKKAPSDPGERYAWATTQCIKKVSGCTADDVTDTYDELIEQSCTAAGISAKMEQTLTDISKEKSKSACDSEIRVCLIADNHCTADYRNCTADADFDKYFSACGVNASGCDSYISDIRKTLIADRDTKIKNAENVLNQIIASHQNTRASKIKSIQAGCADNSARDTCVRTICERNMPNRCGDGFETEQSIALQLCKFYDVACATVD